jgi:hypothetical protein
MRSIRGLAAAITVLLSVPVAVGVAILTGGGAEPIIHFGVGTGMVLLAAAAFDYGLPRALAWFGAVTSGAFGGIFLLQGVADALGNQTLWDFAFRVLGQAPERILPDLIVVWLVALLLVASEGRTRTLGWVVMGILVVSEIATVGGTLGGIAVPDIKLRWLLPFVWLSFESAKSMRALSLARPASGQEFAESRAG